MAYIKGSIVYFNYCGEANTDKVLHFVRLRCHDLRSKKVIIASETGRSALKALKIFKGADVQLVVVTHFPATTWGPKGDIRIGLKRKEYAETLRKLEESGVKIVQGTRPLAPLSRSLGWDLPTPEAVIDKTLEIFGAGTKIALEAAVMATDAGEVNEGEEIISCAGTFKGLDTALVVKASHSSSFFKEFEVKEIIAKPIRRIKKLPEYKFKYWKGDLNQYYTNVRPSKEDR